MKLGISSLNSRVWSFEELSDGPSEPPLRTTRPPRRYPLAPSSSCLVLPLFLAEVRCSSTRNHLLQTQSLQQQFK
jgi:hypothetical protein